MNSKIFILKISDIIELGCRFLVQYICREMLINAYEVFCPSVPVCSKIVDGGARRRRRAVCAVHFSNTILLSFLALGMYFNKYKLLYFYPRLVHHFLVEM